MSREEIMDDLQEPQQENHELEKFIDSIRKYYKTHEFKRSAINDCVSRQVAVYAVAELASSMSVCTSVDECHGMKRMQGMAVRALNDLPSTQPQRIEGKWTINDCHTAVYKYHCSECGANHRARYDFCPSCGADMRGNHE